jgi:hypothetical protein
MFAPLGVVVKGFNKKYRNLFYDSGSAAVLAKAGHVCAVVHRAGFRAGGLRGPIAVVEEVKERLYLSSVVD